MFGQKTAGTVVGYKNHLGQISTSNSRSFNHALVRFTTQDTVIEFTTVEDVVYPVGKKFPVFYFKKNPEKYILANFAGLAMSPKMIIPWVILIFWFGFYLSFNTRPQKKKSHIDLRLLKKQLEKKK